MTQGLLKREILADCADHPEHCGGIIELAKALVNANELDSRILAIEHGAAIKRIASLADFYDSDYPQLGITKGRAEKQTNDDPQPHL